MSTDTRIESLESQVRILKRMLFGVFGVVVVGGLLAATSLQSVPDVVKAKSFQVVTDEGKIVAGIFSTAGGGLLYVSNKDGNPIAAISVEAHGGVSLLSTTRRVNELLISLRVQTGASCVLATRMGN